jgi:hypothetical protein
MRKTIALPRAPSLREANAVLADVERELVASGATVERTGPAGLRFSVPPPWRRQSLGPLAGVSSGTVALSAGGGRPWRVVYTLGFRRLQVFSAGAVALLVAIGWGWARTALVVAALGCWLLTFGVPWALAARRAHRVVRDAARRVVRPPSRPLGQ